MNRLSSLAKSPITAALAWHGYLCLGRGFVHLKTEFSGNLSLVRAEYFSQDQYWGEIPKLEREQLKNRAIYDLIGTYCPLQEYLICTTQGDTEKGKILCFDHLKPPNHHQRVVDLGLFQPEDEALLIFSIRLHCAGVNRS